MRSFVLLLACLGSGCALLSKSQPFSPRYFSPDAEETAARHTAAEPAATQRTAATSPPLELRLGQIDAAAHLEERIAYRPSQGELGYYDSWRWTEPPQAYLRRALARELFERRGLVRVVSGDAPTLSVELTSFEEVREGQPRARVELAVLLRGDRSALLERTLREERTLPAGAAEDPRRLTQSLAQALDAAVSQVADLVSARLAESPPTP